MTDWAASFSRRQNWLDRMGWLGSAAAVVLLFAAGTALAMRLQIVEGLRDARDEAILLDMQPLPPAPAMTAMAEPAPDTPMTEMPEGLLTPQSAPETSPNLTNAPDKSLAPTIADPTDALAPLAPDTINSEIALPPPPKVAPAPRPKPKPKAAPAPVKPAAAPPPSQASPTPKAAAPTAKPGKATAAVPKGRIKDLVARWGASIRAKVQKRNSYPKAAKGAVGTVTLRLKVTRGGVLQSVALAGSSGNPTLDAAALQAVKRAGQFASAPKELTDATYGFTLPLTFSR